MTSERPAVADGIQLRLAVLRPNPEPSATTPLDHGAVGDYAAMVLFILANLRDADQRRVLHRAAEQIGR